MPVHSSYTVCAKSLLLLSVVTGVVTRPLGPNANTPMRAFDDSVALAEVARFQPAPFEVYVDVLMPIKKMTGGGQTAEQDNRRSVDYPRESLAAADQQAQTVIVVFYHGEGNIRKANGTAADATAASTPATS